MSIRNLTPQKPTFYVPVSQAGTAPTTPDTDAQIRSKDSPGKAAPEPSFRDSMKIIVTYLISDLKKKQRSFRIGLLTVLIVTTCITVLMSGITISPLIFMKLSENDVGETDVVLTPAVGSNRTLLNPHDAATYRDRYMITPLLVLSKARMSPSRFLTTQV